MSLPAQGHIEVHKLDMAGEVCACAIQKMERMALLDFLNGNAFRQLNGDARPRCQSSALNIPSLVIGLFNPFEVLQTPWAIDGQFSEQRTFSGDENTT